MTKEIFELPVIEILTVETEDILTWSSEDEDLTDGE